jgi:hypothetical protein
MMILLRGGVTRAAGTVMAAIIFCCAAAHAQNAAPSPVIPAPPGNAQQDLQQSDHAVDPATGHSLVWDAGRKSWIDMQSGQALGFQGAVAKDGTVIPAPAPSVAKSGAKSLAKQDPNDPERAYNPVTGQTLVWNRADSAWIDTRSQKNVGFQGAFAPGTGPPGGGPGASPALGMMYGAMAAGGTDQKDDKSGKDDKKGGSKDEGGGAQIPIIIPISPSSPPPNTTQANAPPPVQPSGGHTVSPPTPANPPTQTAVTPPQQQPATASTPPPAPGEAICGPIVTDKVFATLAKMTRDFNAMPGAKVSACHNLYGLTTFEDSWDIMGLDPGTSPGASEEPGLRGDPDRARRAGPPQASWNKDKGEWRRTDGGTFSPWFTGSSKYCAIPRPDDACAATVQFMGTCQHAQVVNYVMWGRVNKLCSFPLSKARAAVGARSFFGDSEMAQRQLDMTNIGYAANAADEVRQGFLTTPSQFQKCQLKCPVKLPATPPWSYRWIGFNATE